MPLDLQALIAERRSEKFELFERHLNGPLVRVLRVLGYDVDYVRGEGPYLFDAKGNRYLDLLSGFGVFACGRNHPTIIGALGQVLHGQMAGLAQLDVSLLAGLLAERLVARMPWLDKLVFCNSGAEAVETALKLARAATGRTRILHCEHGYHGVTYGALSACGDEHFRERFGPFVGDHGQAPFNDLVALERALAGQPAAALIVEPIQGHGVHVPDAGYLAEVHRLCRRHGALLIAHEVQTGLGRTGRFLACEHDAVEPDMVLLAKALSALRRSARSRCAARSSIGCSIAWTARSCTVRPSPRTTSRWRPASRRLRSSRTSSSAHAPQLSAMRCSKACAGGSAAWSWSRRCAARA